MQLKMVSKQVIIRLYGSPLDKLKEAMQELDNRAGITPELFASDNEFIVLITAKTNGEAAATELCDSAAGFIERAFGDDVYGKGEATLAHAAAGALIKSGAQLGVASAELGALLEEEFKTTKRAEHIFDYGELTYKNERKKLLLSQKTLSESGEASLAAATELAALARKAAGGRYGAALTVPDEDGRRWIAVVDKSKTYARQLQASETPRAGALAVLDLVRRLAEKPVIASPTTIIHEKAKRDASKFAAIAAVVSLFFAMLIGGGLYLAYEAVYLPIMPDAASFQTFK